MRFLISAAMLVAVCLSFGEIKVTVNGEPVKFAGAGPQMIGGRVMVPLRGVMEKLGAFVGWDAPTRTVTAQRGDIDLRLQLNNPQAIINGKAVTMDVPAQQISGTTMVPLRFMGETLGAEVKWDAATETILITTADKGGTTTPPGGGGTTTTPPAAISITGFVMAANPWVRSGDRVDFTLTGTPGGTAVAIVGGLPNEILLSEKTPGTYSGSWVAPDAKLTLSKTSTLGKLKVGTQEILIQGSTSLNIDCVSPTIRVTTPTDGGTIAADTPEISATYGDEGSGIDTDKIVLKVGGKDVTANSSRHAEFLLYRPDKPLSAGAVPVELTVRDVAGNSVTKSWTFIVDAKGTVDVKNFLHDARQGAVPGKLIHFRLDTAAGAKVVLNAGTIKGLPLAEGPAGIYRATYTVKPTDAFDNELVWAEITLGGKTYRAECSYRIPKVGSAAPAAAFKVTSHKEGDLAKDPLKLSGTAPAKSSVIVRIEYVTTVVALRVTGLIAEEEVTADDKGVWNSTPASLNTLVNGKDTEYKVTVTPVDSAGKKGTPITFRLKKG